MLIALRGGERVEATPKGRAECQDCGREALAKCGEIMVWHWAHKATEACEASRYGETDWHLGWKRMFPVETVEQPLVIGGKRHIADVKYGKRVIEFQRKLMPSDIMGERQWFWENAGYMFYWVINAIDAVRDDRLWTYDKRTYYSFRWKKAPARIAALPPPFFLDLGDGWVLLVRKIYTEDRPFGGWGKMMRRQDLLPKK